MEKNDEQKCAKSMTGQVPKHQPTEVPQEHEVNLATSSKPIDSAITSVGPQIECPVHELVSPNVDSNVEMHVATENKRGRIPMHAEAAAEAFQRYLTKSFVESFRKEDPVRYPPNMTDGEIYSKILLSSSSVAVEWNNDEVQAKEFFSSLPRPKLNEHKKLKVKETENGTKEVAYNSTESAGLGISTVGENESLLAATSATVDHECAATVYLKCHGWKGYTFYLPEDLAANIGYYNQDLNEHFGDAQSVERLLQHYYKVSGNVRPQEAAPQGYRKDGDNSRILSEEEVAEWRMSGGRLHKILTKHVDCATAILPR